MMGSWRNFAAWWPLLTAHFRVVAPDLPGCGRSSELPGPHTVAANADVLCALVRQLAVEPVGVAALGLGVAPAIAALGAGLPAQRLVVYAPVYGPTTVRTRFRLLARLAQQRRVTAGLDLAVAAGAHVLTLLRRWLGQEAAGSSSPSLEGGGRGVGPDETSAAADVRHASVRAAVELVYDAVTCDQQSRLARLNDPYPRLGGARRSAAPPPRHRLRCPT